MCAGTNATPLVIGTVLNPTPRRELMAWKTPRIAEIAVGMEINSYACADL